MTGDDIRELFEKAIDFGGGDHAYDYMHSIDQNFLYEDKKDVPLDMIRLFIDIDGDICFFALERGSDKEYKTIEDLITEDFNDVVYFSIGYENRTRELTIHEFRFEHEDADLADYAYDYRFFKLSELDQLAEAYENNAKLCLDLL